MSEPINDGGPAFPMQGRPEDRYEAYLGMSLRAYAAIKLRVPNSGIDWLDEMITAANRDWFAGQALANSNIEEHSGKGWADNVAGQAYAIADAMLKARDAK